MHISKSLVLFLLFVLTGTCLAVFKNPTSYDGAWWQSTKEEQHRGWLAGYIDCSVINQKTTLGFVSWYTLEPEIGKFYKLHPSELTKPVEDVLLEIDKKSHTSRSGEKTQVHEGFDGDYWRQSLPEHRKGYIEGFLVCYRSLAQQKARFSKSPSWYVAQISNWFGVKATDPGEINPERENVSISNVLFKFRDALPRNIH